MSKKSRRGVDLAERPALPEGADVPVVGGREPCPCGSGKRYKACHGRFAREEEVRLVERPFAGLAGECDWVALREIVPAATAPARLAGSWAAEHPDADVTVATVLPMAWPAVHRADGRILIGLQTTSGSGDPSRDVAAALVKALQVAPGSPVLEGSPSGPVPRLQDLLDPAAGFEVTVHEGFDFWLEGVEDLTPEARESMERANASVVPTERLSSVEAAYWCRIGERRHLRWVLPQSEDDILDGLARLHAAGAAALLPGSRYLGSFRAHGLLVPVWDLPPDCTAEELEVPATAMAERLGEAMARDTPLTAEERRAKAGVVSRQLTLRQT